MKSNWRPIPPGLDRFEYFGHDKLTAKHCYFRCSRPLDVDGIKIFDEDDQATNIKIKDRCFAAWSSLSKKFDSINIGGLEHLK